MRLWASLTSSVCAATVLGVIQVLGAIQVRAVSSASAGHTGSIRWLAFGLGLPLRIERDRIRRANMNQRGKTPMHDL